MKFERSDKRKIKATVDLTPLIDVVFQLLIFFMLASTFVVHNQLPIEIPKAEATVEMPQKGVSITLQPGEGGPGGGGPVFLNEMEMGTMEELKRALATMREDKDDMALLIRPDAKVPSGRLVEVMGIASSVGITDYSIEAQPPTTDDGK